MTRFIVAYGTSEGQTEKIARAIATTVRDRGHESETLDVSTLPTDFTLDGYDAVIVGSSIHVGKHQDSVVEFVERYRDALASRPTAFYQVSLSSAVEDEARQAEAANYVDEFVEATDWHPDRIAMFGGALRYSKYGFLTRLLIKRIAKDATGDTDTSRDYEYTDWDEVAAFTNDFAAFVEGRMGVSPDAE
ncbi:menaquinone-dependent protoporphyrinogen IX dehydrogenase [Halomicroarcula sp. GCM10025324]|uniref:menaquinone-dependent protoporphyrinogen IX dehydrogenase n=1 Tax=Haloarcula TaxID=2237 RepID=UPI0023E8D078|nr:menaquinone-dependent protoporphyrinogen IX dehydrogenase [Halomicroarcula sp. ZS-22-S1]